MYVYVHIQGESLLMALKEVAVSSGSACTSASLEVGVHVHARACGMRADETLCVHAYAQPRITADMDTTHCACMCRSA